MITRGTHVTKYLLIEFVFKMADEIDRSPLTTKEGDPQRLSNVSFRLDPFVFVKELVDYGFHVEMVHL